MENIGEQQRELHRAIAAGEIDRAVAMIRPMPALLDTPYSKDVDSKEGTPLHQVLASSNVNMMKALLELNPKQPNVLNNEGRTALSYYDVARINGRSDFMPYFVAVSKGCEVDPNSVKQTNDRALLILKKIRGHFDDRFLEIAKMELDDFCDIETLPNRNKNPKAFCGYLLTLYAADAIAWEVGEGIHSPEPEFGAGMLELIQKQGTHWEKNLETLCKENINGLNSMAQDTMNGFVNYAVLPACFAKHGNSHVSCWIYDDNALGNGALGHTMGKDESYPNILFENRSISECLEVIRCYHENMHRLRGEIREMDAELLARIPGASNPVPQDKWTPLLQSEQVDVPADVLAGQTLPGGALKLTIVELTHDKALADEGSKEKQNNCVADYADSCKEGELRVFSIRSDKGETLSTLGVNLNQDEPFDEYQHYARDNQSPHHTASLSAKWLIRSLNEGKIPTNDIEMMSKTADFDGFSPVQVRLQNALPFGFVPTPQKCEKAFQLFAELKTRSGKPFLSPSHRYSSIAEMDKNTNILEISKHNLMQDNYYGPVTSKVLTEMQRYVDKRKDLNDLPPH